MSIKNPLHLQILKEIKKIKSKTKSTEIKWVQKYLGTDKTYHGFTTKQIVSLAQKIINQHKLTNQQTLNLIDSLYQQGTSFTELALAATILSRSKQVLQDFDPQNLDNWLNYTCGWAEDDVLCQSIFTAEILSSDWSAWQKILKQFNKSPDINKRRASIVLLVKSLRQSSDKKFSNLAFRNIDNLKSEKEILITKAVSWGLRSLVKFHSSEVKIYLQKNKDLLPKIAYRETFRKLTTGKK